MAKGLIMPVSLISSDRAIRSRRPASAAKMLATCSPARVESLARGGAGDRAACEFVRKRGEGGVAESRHHQLAVDFVGHDQYVAAQADVADAAQLSGVQTRPAGLCGLQSSISFTAGSAARRSSASKSTV